MSSQGTGGTPPEDFKQTEEVNFNFISELLDENEILNEQLNQNKSTISELQNKVTCLQQSAISATSQESQETVELNLFHKILEENEKLKQENASLRKTVKNYEKNTSEMLQVFEAERWELIKDNEGLIRDMLQGLCDHIKSDFELAEKNDPELRKTISGIGILYQFNGLSKTVQGVIVATLGLISTSTFGWFSWNVVVWVWPKLVENAELIATYIETTAKIMRFLMDFMKSSQFNNFVKAWKDKRPLDICLRELADVSQLSSLMALAPQAMSVVKRLTP